MLQQLQNTKDKEERNKAISQLTNSFDNTFNMAQNILKELKNIYQTNIQNGNSTEDTQ